MGRLTGLVMGVVLVLSGCAWLFQEHLPSGYEGHGGRTEPDCSSTSGWGFVDGVVAVSSVAGVIFAATNADQENQALYIGSNVGTLVLSAASAITGVGWSSDCRRAKSNWEGGSEERDEEREVKRLQREIELKEEAEERHAPQRREPPSPPPSSPTPNVQPRGFFCTASSASATAGFCTRIKSDCNRTRSIALGAVPDLGECTLIESAFCFDAGSGNEEERCAPSEDSCGAQRTAVRSSSPSGDRIGTCIEQF